ncbi:alpha/beta fold hydrolase [Actinoplanes sp. NPDC000266]
MTSSILTVGETGHGDPILLLHGAAGPDSMNSLIDHLAGAHRVIAPTHPGWDGTERPGDLASVAGLAGLYLDLLAQRDLTGVTVAGVSFGGWVAAEMAVTDRGRRLGRLLIIDAVGPRIEGHPPAMPSGPPPSAPGAPRPGPPPGDMAAFRAYTTGGLEDPALLGRFAGLGIPAQLIWGENDTVVTPEFGRLYAGAIPGARFTVIPGGGHLPMREAPEATFAAIDDFLTAL